MAFKFARQEINIRNQTVATPHRLMRRNQAGNSKKSPQKLALLRQIRSKKRTVRFGILVGNIALFSVVSILIFHNTKAETNPSGGTLQSLAISDTKSQSNPLDKLSSADVAVNVARMTNMEEATAVTNDADTVKIQSIVTSSDDKAVAKPSIVTTDLKSNKDIIRYTAVKGDTISSVAEKFGVTSDTIRISNNLIDEHIPAGKLLWISPVNGIVYIVKSGDTASSLASKYGVSKERIVAFNDAEISGLRRGEAIVIPSATRTGAVDTSTGFQPQFNGNGYASGFCTWGVANIIDIPSNWGNAYSWDDSARLSGWSVSGTPTVGSIAQTDNNHVGIVTAVSSDGSKIKYKDMNGLAGFGQYGETADWVPAHGMFQHFITK